MENRYSHDRHGYLRTYLDKPETTEEPDIDILIDRLRDEEMEWQYSTYPE